ncbi:fumarylacetoacetate hydrolase family protein (plasmid) [Cupriavidus sp. KK10]|jgi:2-keto-4-pentenoate hydratase/2-oxohepta-3-ene-1,7-dioic acid hydratase in catechol pathway|uniref:fumarylacetoacetate hydrolase family protein n=1 Tax=Cupriavidus sp. KK10 TaxID=1478019 RepID=UPI001BAC1A2E|nr:fumarylacetoacetate hydrolase family protein [Cupriavidus sp. KK10]QUN32543.1 fumarylacetoacetate hydrolase family protein [Cupriavidus sp. KK10]
MRFARFKKNGREGIAVSHPEQGFFGSFIDQGGEQADLLSALARGPEAVSALTDLLLNGSAVSLDEVQVLPPLATPQKIICIGLNYADHSAETGFEPPAYPTIFSRFASSLIGHGDAIIRPGVSTMLDYEGEIVVVIGKTGRNIARAAALDHVFGYSLFNDASLRDYQTRTPQWTIGKNFDGTGAFGPYIVTADELPAGAKGLRLQTLLNGEVVQDGNTNDLIFDVATLVSLLSEVMTLSPGDIIVTGTPAGVGVARKPPLWMKPGDVCEVRADGLGVLRNPIMDEA